MTFLQGLRFLILKFNEDLHAKCYVNDDKMVITSLNLYEFSMANNKEMGVLIDKNDPSDVQLYEEAFKEVEYIQHTSQKFEIPSHNVGFVIKNENHSLTEKHSPLFAPRQHGYCIRTGVEIPFNLEKPFCYEAYEIWLEYMNPFYQERFCHFSGEPSNGETSFDKPIMLKNWKMAKEIFNF